MDLYKLIFSVLVFIISFKQNNSMLVKNWGTASHINRLAYSTYDIFKLAFNILTAGQNGVFPVNDIKHNYTIDWKGSNVSVDFHAYNGWLEDLTLDPKGLKVPGKLRRFIISRLQKGLFHKENQHEIFMCEDCMSINAKGLHFAFSSSYYDHECSGQIFTNDITYKISFHMNVLQEWNSSKSAFECNVDLQPISLIFQNELLTTTKESNNDSYVYVPLEIRVEGAGSANFLADTLDLWIFDYINNTLSMSIKDKLDLTLKNLIRKRNICTDFLIL